MLSSRAAAFAVVTFVALPAAAAVTEPNGLAVPNQNAGDTPHLSDLFNTRTEQIDPVADASDLPETFSPLCDFTATLVLRQSSSKFPFGWYNVPAAGAPAPTAAEIVEIIPCG